eukprot:TRINITY_DN3557_c0_g1_i1.p1 TRINITY_DN3557_c0_g1~~TRINITY_DN3557_c0_g1_i1.p1  ORF type:complete len:334 (-),score=44.38 TRINITY_DN3557_c0_g1_i1:88-1089(-)
MDSSRIQCRWGSRCYASSCPYLHPPKSGYPSHQNNTKEQDHYQGSTPCRYGENCYNFECTFGHPPSRRRECMEGVECQWRECPALHPIARKGLCFYGSSCAKPRCPYIHVETKPIPLQSNTLSNNANFHATRLKDGMEAFVTQSFKSAGILPVRIRQKMEVLLPLERKDSILGYNILGGKKSRGELPHTTAEREFYEETAGFIDKQQIAKMIAESHIYWLNFGKYCLYLCLVDSNDLDQLPNKYNGLKYFPKGAEADKLAWVPWDAIQHAKNTTWTIQAGVVAPATDFFQKIISCPEVQDAIIGLGSKEASNFDQELVRAMHSLSIEPSPINK